MEYVATGLAVVFAVLVGRNDGAPLAALGMRSLGRHSWWPPVVLVGAVVAVPALGYHAVAGALADLFAAGPRPALIVLLVATIATLLVSASLGIPTSITLALVGAAAGAQVAHGTLEVDRVLRVLALAAAAPVVAWMLALLVTRVLTLARGRALDRTVRLQQIGGFTLMAIAYGANDGQKLLAVFAVLVALGVDTASLHAGVAALVVACFVIGTLIGLRKSATGLRQGVLRPKPYQVASTMWASAAAVLLGAALAAPVSMTQSATGALIGTCPPREWRRVRWEQSRRIVLAWLWTLPVAALVAFGLTLAASRFTNR